jgi:hypothetical protein
MTTEVSRSPRVGSAIEALVYHRIEVCAKSRGVDPRRAGRRVGKRCSEHEPPWLNWPQLRNRRAVACYDYRSASFYFAEHGGGLIAQLTLRDDAVHKQDRSTCSTL